MTQQTIKIATVAVNINNRITTPVTLEIRPGKGNATINVVNSHKRLFPAMKLVDPAIKIISFTHKTIDFFDELYFENYTSVFKEIFKSPKSSRVYITHKIESAIPLSVIKYGNKNQLSNIFATLVNHNAYLSHRQFESHKEHSIGVFSNINPNVILRDSLRQKIQHDLMWVDLNDEESKPMIHTEKYSTGNETDRIIIPVFICTEMK